MTMEIMIKRLNEVSLNLIRPIALAQELHFPYRFPIVQEKTGPSVSADLIKCSGIAVIPPRSKAPKNGRIESEGGYRFPSSLTSFCLNRHKSSKAATTVKAEANTRISPTSNICEKEAHFKN